MKTRSKRAGIEDNDMKKLILLAALMACGCACAEKWVVISDGHPNPETDNRRVVVQIDVDSIRQRDGYRQVWEMHSFFPAKYDPIFKTFGSASMLYLMDCKNEESALVSVLFYPLAYGAGAPTKSFDVERVAAIRKMSTAPPGSYQELTVKSICARPIK